MTSQVFPLYFYTLTIFIILLTLRATNGAENPYEICSHPLSLLCGSIHTNVSYPFWGLGRPKRCGHPALQLTSCYKDFPVVKIGYDGLNYDILDIQKSSRKTIIRLRGYSENHTTCPFPLNNKIFDKLFQFTDNVENVTLSYKLKDLSYPEIISRCSTNSSDSHTTIYYDEADMEDAQLTEVIKRLMSCKRSKVLVLKKELNAFCQSESNKTLYDIWKQGFEVEFQESPACSECQISGGICGSSLNNTEEDDCFHKDPRAAAVKCGSSSNDTEDDCSPKHRKSGKWKLIVGLAVPGVFLILLSVVALNVGLWCYMKPKLRSHTLLSRRLSSDPMNSDLEIGSSFCGIPILSYSELQEATNNFDESQELGDGGFGIVYYGKLRDGREVAVKRLYEKNYKRIGQFMNEIEILARLRHPNLVTLYGCTSRNSRELLLVYEFIRNGTVADHLHGDRKGSEILSWCIRMKIATETATALAYLHSSDIIHRDVKTNNILLDNNFSVKVADFGLSRLFPGDATHVSTVPQGTPGYLDPEYRKFYQVTNKSDVYSFGVVLVELISSLPAIDLSRQQDEINLSDYAMKRIQHGTLLTELVDQKLDFESNFKVKRMITLVAELAFQCLQQEKELRPCMTEVLEALKQIENVNYEELEAEYMDHFIATAKIESVSEDSETKPPPENSEQPPSPNSVIVNWVSRSSTNTSS
ncbi:LEAF RUST 10 DISEASE-RESISTANCE LOCUS RECEPTOR-LIKE PROTEIN KINASE-like 1.2 [Beta vulgaris subsp. vulgaris]|uniref:LEAF RUST 10 DISEASE-RESISTANCE LOCUS RECEPTOR-LIKE PROTEIN KINASE-like 1.2 n=1 Tax=Beta vulgaris subsp. vulgaris TaxID=3555 RepID=UPI0020372537|nr:LEAF RUST 10 DISEASE-RESISTANCE LOCUS RECEPTOR-LIKE PROTEIN KINASE-like 1.2 [Beta vulgaris subsp. vulgaris]